jgi:hypothetical protein
MTDYNQEELLVNWPHRGADDSDNHRAAEKALRRDTLLEHWPERKSSVTITSFDSRETDEAAAASSCHCVDFSESSQLHMYEREPMSLLRSLAYTKKDRDEFGKDAFLEGNRIKNLIAAAPPESTAESIKYLLRHDVISREELIGIEHFILGKPTRVVKIRKLHAAAVLWKQLEQRHEKHENPALNLSKFAEKSSLRSTERARIRAAMAA